MAHVDRAKVGSVAGTGNKKGVDGGLDVNENVSNMCGYQPIEIITKSLHRCENCLAFVLATTYK
jgi:hypothetical protein